MRLDPAVIRHQVDGLLAAYPELVEDEVLRLDMIEGSTDLVDFVRRLERSRQEASALTEAIAMNVDALRARAARFERREQAIRDLMFRMLELAHLKKLEMPEATVSVRVGVPKVIVTDEAALPDEFCRIKREPDKGKIKAALADFQAVPGATLSNAEDTLAIRVK
jgi:hypothetical protein